MITAFKFQQVSSLREQIAAEGSRNREVQENVTTRIRSEEQQRCSLEERLEKAVHELQAFKADHICLSEYLVRLAHALCWGECSEPPVPGEDTRILAETLLERADRLSADHDNHVHHEKVDKPIKTNLSSTVCMGFDS